MKIQSIKDSVTLNCGVEMPCLAYGTWQSPVGELTRDGVKQTVFAWDMTQSGLYENFSGDRPSVCVGQTIFGLTSTTGQSDIYDINYVANIDEYVKTATAIGHVQAPRQHAARVFDLQGRVANGAKTSTVTIVDGRKTLNR